jgi:hypothetical protein
VRRIVYGDTQDKYLLGEQIGYVSHELAEDLAPKMDLEGFVLLAWIMNVTGEDSDSLGVNIQIEEYKPTPPRAAEILSTTLFSLCALARHSPHRRSGSHQEHGSVVAVNLFLSHSQPCFNRFGVTSKRLT